MVASSAVQGWVQSFSGHPAAYAAMLAAVSNAEYDPKKHSRSSTLITSLLMHVCANDAM